MIQLDPRSEIPLYEQIYRQILADIKEGVYPAGYMLPSIRNLSTTLRCSRNTVGAAYRMLVQEGFVESRPGSGYIVSEHYLSDLALSLKGKAQVGDASEIIEVKQEDIHPLKEALYDFTYGNLQPGTFPTLVWKHLMDEVLLSSEAEQANFYTNNEGEMELREEICRVLTRRRGIRCSPEQIIIQGGTQASLQNLLLLFDPQSDVVAMEEPGYDGARVVFERCQFELAPCPVGLTHKDYLDAVAESHARLIYTTPSNQFPLGLVMNQEMRLELLQWAHDNDAYIIEDDYCYEFNYREQPQAALRTLDHWDRVIYMGTFSKSLSPSLRINFLVLPEKLHERWKTKYYNAYPAVTWLGQKVLARFLASNYSERHINRVQTKARNKYVALMEALAEYMGDRVEVIESGAGLHVLVNVKDGRSQAELIASAREKGVRVYGTDRYWMQENHPLASCILLGFSFIDEAMIRPGIEVLTKAWFPD